MRRTRSSKTRRMVNACRREAEGYANKRVAKFRSLAAHQFLLRRSCVEESRKAYREGDGAKAKHFSLLAADHKKKFYDLHKRASQEQFLILNRNKPDFEVDLHGLYVNEAVQIVKERLIQLRDKAPMLRAIVGKGNHSRGIARIKTAMQQFLKGHSYKYSLEDGNGGVFLIDVTSGNPEGTEVYQEEDFSIMNGDPSEEQTAVKSNPGPIESILIEDSEEEQVADSDSDIEIIEVMDSGHDVGPQISVTTETTQAVGSSGQNTKNDDNGEQYSTANHQEISDTTPSNKDEAQPRKPNPDTGKEGTTGQTESKPNNIAETAMDREASDDPDYYHSAEEGNSDSAKDIQHVPEEEHIQGTNDNLATSPNPFDEQEGYYPPAPVVQEAPIMGIHSPNNDAPKVILGMNPDGSLHVNKSSPIEEDPWMPLPDKTVPVSDRIDNVESEEREPTTKKRKRSHQPDSISSTKYSLGTTNTIDHVSIKEYDANSYFSPKDPENEYLTRLHSDEEKNYAERRYILNAVYTFLITNNVCEDSRKSYLDYLGFICERNEWKKPNTSLSCFPALKSSQICSWIRFLRFNPSYIHSTEMKRFILIRDPAAVLIAVIHKGHDISTDERIVLEVVSREVGIYTLGDDQLQKARSLVLETMALCQSLTHPERPNLKLPPVPSFAPSLNGHHEFSQWVMGVITRGRAEEKTDAMLIKCLPDFLPYLTTFVRPAFLHCRDPSIPLLMRKSLVSITMNSLTKSMKKQIQDKFPNDIEKAELTRIISYIERRKHDKAVSVPAPRTKEYLKKLKQL